MLGNAKFMALALGLGLGVSNAAWAQAATSTGNTASAAPTKVGIVMIQDAIFSTNDGKKEMNSLQARFAPKQNELKTQNDEVEKLKKDLETQGPTLSEEARASRVRTLEAKQKTLQRNYDDYQNEAQQAQQEMLNRLGSKMMPVLEAYANANGYSVILDVSNPQTPVLWANKGTNITQQVVDAYNAQNPAAPAAPAAKPSGAAANKPTGTPAPAKP
jgi:outer membrane protein